MLISLDYPRKSHCDCLHAAGRRIICKHMVATYFEIFPSEAKQMYEEQQAYERLLDVGIHEAAGVDNWVDGKYSRPFHFAKGSLQKDETFTISTASFSHKLLLSNQELFMDLFEGKYVFVENHVVLNDPIYIKKNHNHDLVLTEYARLNLEKCAVKFKCKAVNQDYGVNLICTDEGIDSSQASGRLLISVLSAVAQIERENIVEQTMNGRRKKTRQGLWNGGMAPYGYKLVDGVLKINEEETKIVKLIFDKYVNTSISLAGISKYLNDQGITKEKYGNRNSEFWNPTAIRKIVCNPTYIGKIEWGHRTMKKIKGTKMTKRVYQNDNVILSDGQHEAIIDEDTFRKAQEKKTFYCYKMNCTTKKLTAHPLSGILKCPICGGNMASSASNKLLKNGNKIIKNYYSCGNSKGRTQIKCEHEVFYDGDSLEFYVRQAISKVVTNDEIIRDIKNKIGSTSDAYLNDEINNYEKRLKSLNVTRTQLEHDIDFMDCDLADYTKRREQLNARLNPIYDSIFEIEDKLEDLNQRKNALEND